MSKAALPDVKTGVPDVDQYLANAKQNLDDLFGQRRGSVPLKPLPSTATTAEVIAALNQIIARLT